VRVQLWGFRRVRVRLWVAVRYQAVATPS